MAAKGVSVLLQQIIDNIYTNTSNDIDGDILQSQLTDIIDSLNQNLYNALIPYNAGQSVIIDEGGFKKVYLCITNTTPGESPVTTPAKWELASAAGIALSSIELDVTALKAVTGYNDEEQILLNSNNSIYSFDVASVTAGDDNLVITPDDITEPAPGRWLKIKTLVDITTTGVLADLTTPVATTLALALNAIAKSGIEIVDNITALKAIPAARRDIKTCIVRYYDEDSEGAVSGGVNKILFYKGVDLTDTEWETLTNWYGLQPNLKTAITTTATNLEGIPVGTVITLDTDFETIWNLLLVPYIPPTIGGCTIEETPTGNNFEVGASVDIDSITIAVNNDSEGNPPLTLNIAGTGYNVAATVGVNVPPAPLTVQQLSATSEVWTISGTDKNSDPINEVTVQISWFFKHFVGASNTDLNSGSSDAAVTAVLNALQNKVLRYGKEAEITCSATYNLDGYYAYIAYAASYGTLNEILMNNSINVVEAFEEVSDFNYTNTEGHIESYKLYKSNSSGAFENGDILTIS